MFASNKSREEFSEARTINSQQNQYPRKMWKPTMSAKGNNVRIELFVVDIMARNLLLMVSGIKSIWNSSWCINPNSMGGIHRFIKSRGLSSVLFAYTRVV